MPAAKKSSAKAKPGAAKPGMPREAADALAKVENELAKLEPHELAPINVDIPRAVSVAIGAVPHLNALRESVVEELPRPPSNGKRSSAPPSSDRSCSSPSARVSNRA